METEESGTTSMYTICHRMLARVLPITGDGGGRRAIVRPRRCGSVVHRGGVHGPAAGPQLKQTAGQHEVDIER